MGETEIKKNEDVLRVTTVSCKAVLEHTSFRAVNLTKCKWVTIALFW